MSALIEQYETYPYPPREAADEAKRLVEGSPSALAEIEHYLFAGRLPQGRPFRALVAGGGTGDALVMLAQHSADRGCAAELTYLDLSTASRTLAEARIAARGLSGMVRFVTGSLLEVAQLAPGPYDYIDCCGVLHHLPQPEAGLAALAEQLAPGGGLGLMLYGTLGRQGVYPLQQALRRLTVGQTPSQQVATAKRLLASLPATNGFRRNPFLGDHRVGDAALYDLLLHSQDRAYLVDELAALVAGAGLRIAAFVAPAAYDPAFYIADTAVLAPLEPLDAIARAAFAEQVAGSITKHTVYVTTAPGSTVARFDGRPDWVLVAGVGFDPVAVGAALKPGQPLTITINGLRRALPMPHLAGPILALVDGQRSLGDIQQALPQARALPWPRFAAQIDTLLASLGWTNHLLLRGPA